ncbi:MAG: hypothetical protein GTN53_10855 [Candidatus Aminicenantes bacterium]|nr:hypothetical protein [Candidatus Aminicenantes bacterium]NIT22994.1 hypothetical protein [Candidatus Aminicenantes bacterium]
MKKMGLLILLLPLMTVSLFPGKLSVLPELTNPGMMTIDGDELYVLDEVVVYVYSLKDYCLLRKFGKKGEGPGELLPDADLPITMQVLKEQVLVNSFNKLVCFSKTGKMITEKRIPFFVFQIIPFGKNYAVTKFTRYSDGRSKVSVLLFDNEFKEIKTLYETELLNDQGKGKIAFPLITAFIRVSGNQLSVVDQKMEFLIQRFDLEGNRLPPIKKAYQKIKVTDSFKKESMEWLSLQPAFKSAPERARKMIYFPPYLPVIRNLAIKDQKLYVQTYKTRGQLFEFFILDLNGKVLKTVFLPDEKNIKIAPTPTPRYDFKENKFYYLQENVDEETWELHVQEI